MAEPHLIGRSLRSPQPSVYSVCMPRVNVYLPDELVVAVRPLGLNLSHVLQGAIRDRLDSARLEDWLRDLDQPVELVGGRTAIRQALDRADVGEWHD